MSSSPKSVLSHGFNAVRGALIGVAEVLPGISGGTVALITGVFESLVTSAGHVISGIKMVVADVPRGRGLRRAGQEFAKAKWGVIVPVAVGMVIAALVAARTLTPIIEEHEAASFAVFFGLVLASLWVPYSMSGRHWGVGQFLAALAAGAVGFTLSGLPPGQIDDPPAVLIFFAAAVAICALVMPGASGSFILLSIGLYTTTMNALNNGDLGYIAIFAAGAAVGLSLFVKLLQWLLEHYHRITLVVMTGLLAGSLRALWPWQEEDRTPLMPTLDSLPLLGGLIAIGFGVVALILVLEHQMKRRNERVAHEQVGASTR
ncbi:DUF368 domain-containing protein [Spiractinospora alimapuensis]|uniref:DUF368 domain-containing protein n=1 Tax=Spiractinospora alimapuensis TaxID=2820884 RepID=UPI001F3F87BF|nr:DUF368 domain-containing protein [Spiractinospora alimapuensis]QVQ53948.1 DUF368 domain-containing protein [Spiractinospora alimapuensis]